MDIHYYDTYGYEQTVSVSHTDDSYRYREICGADNGVTLNFSLTEYIDFPTGSWIEYQGETYRLFDIPDKNTKQNNRQFDYTLVFHDPTAWLKRFKTRNTVDGRLNFVLTAQPQEFVKLIVDNLNDRDTSVIWRVGDCVVSAEKTQSFAQNSLLDALNTVASLFETEWEIRLVGVGSGGKKIYQINLKKVEYNKATADYNDAQQLSYGRGNGILPGINRGKGQKNAVDVVWCEGGDRNIDSSTYVYHKEIAGRDEGIHANKLRLPVNCTIFYIPPSGDTDNGMVFKATDFDPYEIDAWVAANNPITFMTDADGFGLHRRPAEYVNGGYEEALDLSDIYPCLKLNVTEAILHGYNDTATPDPEEYSNRFWDIVAEDNEVNYNDYMIGGEQPTIVFNTGMLAGKEFNIAEVGQPDGSIGCYDAENKKFLITSADIDGIVMPDLPLNVTDKDGKSGTGYIPAVGDEFAVFHVSLPREYIDKAEREMLLEAAHYLYIHGEVEVEFSITVDGIWSQNKWSTMRQYFVLGGYIKFFDDDMCQDGRLLRILSIKEYISRPHAPELTLSNSTVSQSVSSELKKIPQNEVYQKNSISTALEYTNRGFKDAEVEREKLDADFSERLELTTINLTNQITNVINDLGITQQYYNKSIDVTTVHALQLILGDKNMQFAFGHATANATDVVTAWERHNYEPTWNDEGKAMMCPSVFAGTTLEVHVRHEYWTRAKDAILSTEADAANHPYWIVNEALLTADIDGVTLDPGLAYYLYLQAPSGAATEAGWGKLQYHANFVLSNKQIDAIGDDLYLCVGLLNPEFNGKRSYSDMYSFTEITGGQIKTDYIGDKDSNFYIDLIDGIIKGVFNIVDGAISKEVIFGGSREDNNGGITGDEVRFGDNIGKFQGRQVRLWIGHQCRLLYVSNTEEWSPAQGVTNYKFTYVDANGRREEYIFNYKPTVGNYIFNASAVLFDDGSFLFRKRGTSNYIYFESGYNGGDGEIYTPRKITTTRDMICKNSLAEWLQVSKNHSNTQPYTYIAPDGAQFIGNVYNQRTLPPYTSTSVKYKGIMPMVLWHGQVIVNTPSSVHNITLRPLLQAMDENNRVFTIEIRLVTNDFMEIKLPDNINRAKLLFFGNLWTTSYSQSNRKYGYFNFYPDTQYVRNNVPTEGHNYVYVRHTWDGDDEDIENMMLTIMTMQ